MKNPLSTYDALYNYGMWYYLKYFSSRGRVKDKLLEKSGYNRELTQEVLTAMEFVIEEQANIRARIKHYLFRNKNINYIKTELLRKKFDAICVEKILNEEFVKEDESLLDAGYVQRKVEYYKNKGKSNQYILQKLIDRSIDRELVVKVLDDNYPENEVENIKREYEKISTKYEKHKIIEKLLRKGFKYEQIKKAIND